MAPFTISLSNKIVEMSKDHQTPLIFGKTFMATMGEIIDMPNKRVSFSNINKKVFYKAVPTRIPTPHTSCILVVSGSMLKVVPKKELGEKREIKEALDGDPHTYTKKHSGNVRVKEKVHKKRIKGYPTMTLIPHMCDEKSIEYEVKCKRTSKPFSKVRVILTHELKKKGKVAEDDNNGDDGSDEGAGGKMKKHRRVDEKEEKLQQAEQSPLFPIPNPPLFETIGVKPPSWILFHGPPGCRKTQLANAIANEVGVPFYQISATQVVFGASEENIRELFSKAYMIAPSIVFIDEIDATRSKRENPQKEMEKRIGDKNDTASSVQYVFVIGATNRNDALDYALRRSGRFELQIFVSIPDEDARAEILSLFFENWGLT
ncbi:hypothetical protein N665_0026s0061 [Sinapis alba]|nr:hypothetical protein N665_0026s0061 [Sinapis alba]